MTVAASAPCSCTLTFKLVVAGVEGATGATPVVARPRPWNWTVGAAAHEPPKTTGSPGLWTDPADSEAGAAAACAGPAWEVALVLDVCASSLAGMTVEEKPLVVPRAERAEARPTAASTRQTIAKTATAGRSHGTWGSRSGARPSRACGAFGCSPISVEPFMSSSGSRFGTRETPPPV